MSLTPDHIREIRSALAEVNELRERLSAELAHWGELCERFAELQRQMATGQRVISRACDDSDRIYSALIARIKELNNDPTDEWWRTGTEPPEFDE